VALQVMTGYAVSGIEITNHKTTLAHGKGEHATGVNGAPCPSFLCFYELS
jgi:hypothetical protein